jgi:hypothetical protein
VSVEELTEAWEAPMHLVYAPEPAAFEPIGWDGFPDRAGVLPIAWTVSVEVLYRVAPNWRAPLEDERCRQGAGGRNRPACGTPAVVTFDKHMRDNRVVPYPYCRRHSGGRVVLEDGRVAEPAVGEA